ncbi:hypothetical protein OsI_30796 [Oryza sativa Indica Group]|uniref:DUF834 domain-containing protein n=1 Tax=Oryza sativa subsp. indica TaxID=39946 RepID=A2YZL5_ORYSI|nr:hypothetical protein OsI_30796 [Oryza sativa Indica Group]
MVTGGTSSWRERRPEEGNGAGATSLGPWGQRGGVAEDEDDEMTPTAVMAQRGNAPARREACRRTTMKATSPLLTSEDEFPAVSRRNGGEAGGEEVAAKQMVLTPGSEEVPTAGEGRPDLRDSGGTRRRRRGGQGERRGRAAVCGERGGGRDSFL